MRVLFALLLVLPLLSRAQGPYSVLLANGDTLTGKEHFIRGDSLGLRGGPRVALKDIALFWTPKERWTFTYPAGKMRRIKEEGSDACILGRITAERSSEHITAFDSLAVPLAWKQRSGMLECYRSALEERGIVTHVNGDRIPFRERDDHMVHLRNGDSLAVGATFYSKTDSLCWMGGGRMHKDNVLWVRTKDRRMYMVDRSSSLVAIPGTIDISSDCGKGELLTRIYDGSTRTEAEINTINAGLLGMKGVAACFAYPGQERIRPGIGAAAMDSSGRSSDDFRSYFSSNVGYGMLHGGLGLNTIIGPNGTGLSIGLGSASGEFFYSFGAQVAVKRIFYVNFSYGIINVEAIRTGNSERRYTDEGYIFGTGFMFGPTKEPRLFFQLGMTYSGGATRTLPFGGTEKIGGPGVSVGMGFRF